MEPPRNHFDESVPQNIEAEQCVLGSILLDNETLHEVMSILKARDFYRESHRAIYRAILELRDLSRAVDVVALAEELRARGEYEKVGGDGAMRKILEAPPHAANARYYAQIVRQKSISRELIQGAREILREACSNSFSAEELLQSAERRIFAIAEDRADRPVAMKDALTAELDRVTARAEERKATDAVPTGYFDLDEITGGLRGGQLVVLGSRPSMGRTSLALNICEHALCELKRAALLVSMQQGEDELMGRFLTSRSRVDGHKILTGKNLGQQDLVAIGRALADLRLARLVVLSSPSLTASRIASEARRLRRREGLDLLVVDEIQLVEPDVPGVVRHEQLARVSRQLKQLAMELDIPVLALSQLNDNRGDRLPWMADLRGTGAIEQDADLVLLLHRPEYYDVNDQPGVAELIIAKNRAGATATVKFAFVKNLTRFENLARIADPLGGAF